MILTYEAVDAAGKRSHDVVEARDRTEAADLLRRRGLFVTNLAPQAASSRSRAASRPAARGRLPLKTLALFTRQMAMLLRAGSGLVPALAAIKRQMAHPRQAAILGRLITDLEDGTTLTDALRRHPHTFDAVYCAILAAGEASGSLAPMFERLAGIVGSQRTMRKKIVGAVAYPVLLMAMCLSILNVLMFFVLPRFAGMFKQLGVTVPPTTALLLQTGEALRNHWPMLLALTLGAAALAAWAVRTEGGQQWLADVQLRLPLLGRLRSRLIQAQVFRTMGTLLVSRVGVLDTLELVRQSTRNTRYQRLFDGLESAVTSGGQLSQAFEASGLVEPAICQAVHTGEDSGALGDALNYCADVLDENNTELISMLTRLIEPVILITMGLVVGAVAISLFLPLFDLTSAIH